MTGLKWLKHEMNSNAFIIFLFMVALSLVIINDAQFRSNNLPTSTPNPIPHYTCDDGTTVSDLKLCPHCPATCDDKNPCTIEVCGKGTNYRCEYKKLSGPQPDCSKSAGFCKALACSAGKCIVQNQTPCAGNGICESGETCDTTTDCACTGGQLCCSGACRLALCSKDSDCDDNVADTLDKCEGTGCSATCTNTKITECKNGDGFCPPNCNALSDNDCQAHSIGETVKINKSNYLSTGEFELTIRNYRLQDCLSDYSYLGTKSWGRYLVIDVKVFNPGNTAVDQYGAFTLLDSRRNQFESTSFVMGDNCNVDGLKLSKLYPGVTDTGEVWFKLGDVFMSGLANIIYRPNAYYSGNEVIFKMTVS